MDKPNHMLFSPELIPYPVFRVENNIITQVNDAARCRQISVGTDVRNIIRYGLEEYDKFQTGRLDLTLCIDGSNFCAYVVPLDHAHVFCMESEYFQPELRAFSLASQQLREPLTNAMISANALLSKIEDKDIAAKINRSLHQMMRVLSNMSDAVQYSANKANLRNCNVVSVVYEILEKAETLLSQSGKKITFQLPAQPFHCNIDSVMVERAILNLISNAASYSPDGALNAQLNCSQDRLRFTVENNITSAVAKDLFDRYLREPSIEDGRNGIGLGLPLVRSVAAAHGGTVLMEQTRKGKIRITMTLSVRNSDIQTLREPTQLPVDLSGGWDHCLLELSDILSTNLYEM